MFRVVRAEEKNCYNILAGKLDASVLDEQLIVAQYITLHNETDYLLSTPFLLFAKDAGTDRALLTIHTTMPLLVKMFRGGQLLEDGLFIDLLFFLFSSFFFFSLLCFSSLHLPGGVYATGSGQWKTTTTTTAPWRRDEGGASPDHDGQRSEHEGRQDRSRRPQGRPRRPYHAAASPRPRLPERSVPPHVWPASWHASCPFPRCRRSVDFYTG